MTVRAVEWKNPYTWGKGIEIDENKVISLRLRDENNLIIWDRWDNEIYVDLQLDDEIRPTDAFPVWITTGRVIIDNGWDKTWTLICAKTTSGDNIKIFYSDDGHLYVDHWTWLFTQVYLKPEVDALLLELRNYVDTELAKKQDKLIAWDRITINADWKTINADLQVSDIAYWPSWDWVTNIAPSKNAVYDKIDSIDALVPSAATPSNKLADKNYVDDSINQVAAYYITKNAQWDAFATYAELSSATTFYSWWVQRTPTRNDFCMVLADETHSGDCTRYSYQNSQWEYQYTINESPMTQAQVDAINSGITANKVNTYDWYASQISWKQDALTAGSNIQIDANNVISATDTKYTAWNWINIDANNEISVDTSVVATQSDINWVIKQWVNTVTQNIELKRGTNEKIVLWRTDDWAWITITEWSWSQQQYIEYENWWIDVKTPGSSLQSYNFDNSNNGIVRFKDLTLKQDKLTAWTWINIDANNKISNTLPWAIKSSTAPSNPSQWDQWYDTANDELKIYDGSAWNAVGGGWGWDVVWPSSATDWHLAVFDWATGKLLKDWWVIPVWLSSQAGNVFTSWMTIWGGSSSDYSSLTPAPNTAYLII